MIDVWIRTSRQPVASERRLTIWGARSRAPTMGWRDAGARRPPRTARSGCATLRPLTVPPTLPRGVCNGKGEMNFPTGPSVVGCRVDPRSTAAVCDRHYTSCLAPPPPLARRPSSTEAGSLVAARLPSRIRRGGAIAPGWFTAVARALLPVPPSPHRSADTLPYRYRRRG